MANVALQGNCIGCKNEIIIVVQKEDFEKYKKGEKVQDVFPYLNSDDREFIISKICPKCWDKMFPKSKTSLIDSTFKIPYERDDDKYEYIEQRHMIEYPSEKSGWEQIVRHDGMAGQPCFYVWRKKKN